MRILSAQVFDDVIAGTGTWYSSSELNSTIGAAETIVIQACTTGVVTGSKLTVECETSADNQNWSPALPPKPIDQVTILNDGSYVGVVGDPAMLANVRFKITLFAAADKCRLKLYVTGRVAGGMGTGAG